MYPVPEFEYIFGNGGFSTDNANSAPLQLPKQVPAFKESDGSDGGVIVPDLGLSPTFYSGFPRFAVRPSPITQ